MRDRPLVSEEFGLWYHMAIRFRQMQSKEGREQIRLAVTARAFTEDARGGSQETEQQRLARAAWATPDAASTGAHDASFVISDDETALRAVIRGGVIPPWMYARPDLLLRALPPDDPRARYLRAGGRLDENGNPVIVALNKHASPPAVPKFGASSSSSAPPPSIPSSASPDQTDVDARAVRDLWTRGASDLPDLPTLPPLP